jgi:hypothetical protein
MNLEVKVDGGGGGALMAGGLFCGGREEYETRHMQRVMVMVEIE